MITVIEAKTRRLENNLSTMGTGIIAFGLWSFIKLVLTTLLIGKTYFEDATDEEQIYLNIAVWIIAVLSVLMYLWLGLSARAESKGKHKKPVYLFFVGMIALYSAAIILFESFTLIIDFINIEDPLTFIVSIIIDATRLVFLIELIYSSISLRRIRKKDRKEVSAT